MLTNHFTGSIIFPDLFWTLMIWQPWWETAVFHTWVCNPSYHCTLAKDHLPCRASVFMADIHSSKGNCPGYLTFYMLNYPEATYRCSWISYIFLCWKSLTSYKKSPLTKTKITRTTRMLAFWGYPAALWSPILLSHIGSQVKRRWSQSYKFKEFDKISNFPILKQTVQMTCLWSFLIRCANIKWIRRVLLKIQRRHDSVQRRTDGQGETSIPPPFNFIEAWGIKILKVVLCICCQVTTINDQVLFGPNRGRFKLTCQSDRLCNVVGAKAAISCFIRKTKTKFYILYKAPIYC